MKKGEHISLKDLTRYFLNEMSRDEETSVQEHLSECTECRKKIHDMRKLKIEFDDVDRIHDTRHFFIRAVHSSWTKAAATIILIAGLGIAINQISNMEKGQSFPVQDKQEIKMAIDTFRNSSDTTRHSQYHKFQYDSSEVITSDDIK